MEAAIIIGAVFTTFGIGRALQCLAARRKAVGEDADRSGERETAKTRFHSC